MLYDIVVLVFAAAFFASMAVYLLLRSRFVRNKQALVRRLDGIARGNVQNEEETVSILKDESLSGIPTFHQILSRLSFSRNLRELIQQAGMEINVGTFVLMSLCLGGGATVLISYLTGEPLPALAAGLFLCCVPYFYVRYRRRKRIDRFEETLPEALDLISNGLKSGFSFESALRMVGEELPDPLGEEFTLAFEEQNLGVGLMEALRNMRRRVPSQDLDLFLISISIHKKTGGQLAEVLGNTAGTIRDRFRLKREIRTKTVHSRFSGMVLIFLPIAMIGCMLILNPDYIMILLDTKTGNYMLAAAFVMQMLGVWIIRRIIDIKY